MEGVVASPFLFSDTISLYQLGLVATGDRPFFLKEGTVVATFIFLPQSQNPSLYALQQPISTTQPFLEVVLDNIPFKGLVDTGADVSVIRTQEWPSHWPVQNASSVQGVGGAQPAKVSSRNLFATASCSAITAVLRPYILPLHCNLWGRDLLSQFQLTLNIP